MIWDASTRTSMPVPKFENNTFSWNIDVKTPLFQPKSLILSETPLFNWISKTRFLSYKMDTLFVKARIIVSNSIHFSIYITYFSLRVYTWFKYIYALRCSYENRQMHEIFLLFFKISRTLAWNTSFPWGLFSLHIVTARRPDIWVFKPFYLGKHDKNSMVQSTWASVTPTLSENTLEINIQAIIYFEQGFIRINIVQCF